MITIQYQILRYLPDRVSGEFVNLGIVAFDSSKKILKSKFINKFKNTPTVVMKLRLKTSSQNIKYILNY